MSSMKNKEELPPGCCFFFQFTRSRSSNAIARQIEPAKPAASKQAESDKASLLVPAIPKSSANTPPSNHEKHAQAQGHGHAQGHGLKNMLREGRRSIKRASLIRASSSNIMLFGNLGNVRGKKSSDTAHDVLDYLPKTAMELSAETSRDCSAEEMKEMGNEEYKKGRYVEALALYEKAIAKDPNKASYWSNKAAALLGLGRLIEAVDDCRTAVKIDPSYSRAHYRLSTLYLRLGEAEKAIDHYKMSQNEVGPNEMSRAQGLQTHLAMAEEARKIRDWSSLLKLAQGAVSSGADSAPQVFASQAEALLNLNRHEEADSLLANSPKFDVSSCMKFYGDSKTAYILSVKSRVDMAAGRFEDAVETAGKATELDPNNKDTSLLAQKALKVKSLRLKGNDLFKASNFDEAYNAYGDGLKHDPHNAILLFNRAACQSKLGNWEKAIQDCDMALKFRPSYCKARLRRADCNFQLERWEASVEDYEILLRQMPGDEEVVKKLFEAHVKLKKQRKEVTDSLESDSDNSNES